MLSKRYALVLGLVAFATGLLLADTISTRVSAQEAKGPQWSHGLMLRARKADEAHWTAETKKIGIEVFVDENNGNLIYITENGAIAVVKK